MAAKSHSRSVETLNVEGRDVSITNLDKLMYPEAGFSKAQVIDFYIRVSRYLLPHLRDRPVTMKRYPDGVAGQHFYEKDAPKFTPDWVQLYPVPRRAGGTDIRYVLINDLPTLVWAANLANLEIHPFLHRTPELDRPEAVVFDLDPGEGTGVLECAEVAFLLKAVLDGLKLDSVAKVSGSKGLQVYVPLNSAVSYEQTQPFARTLAQLLEREHPGRIISEMAKKARAGKVFIDWSQNSDFKTTVGVYSLRAKRAHPFVSMPVKWSELEAAIAAKDPTMLEWGPAAALDRLDQLGDLFDPVLKLRQRLPGKKEAKKTGGKKIGGKKIGGKKIGGKKIEGKKTEGKTATIPDLERLPEARIQFVEPMQAKLVAELPRGEQWQYEIKLDGYRALALRDGKGVRLLSRNNKSLNQRFGVVAEACRNLPENTVCDGEIVALDEHGRPSFNGLQNWHGAGGPLLYYIFDLLAYQGKSLLSLPLRERQIILIEALKGMQDPVRVLGILRGEPEGLIDAARKQGMEGLIAKRSASLYEPGQRSGAWAKFKVNQGQELVVGGYMPGGKHHFESLLVGYYEAGELMFIGKLRNGFVPKSREEVFTRLEPLESDVCPFANLPEPRSARRGEALTAEVMKKCRWIRPELVIQAEFTDWTEANHLRHSRFAGLRDDKNPREVVHERM